MRRLLAAGGLYGNLVFFIGVLLLIPLAVLPFYPGETAVVWPFLAPALCSMALGLCISALRLRFKDNKTKDSQPEPADGSVHLLFAWFYGFFAGALPFVLGGELDFIHALFESISGWTTTGLTVSDIASMPHIFLFYRSFTQYCGGLGFILMIAAMIQRKQDAGAFSAEGHLDRLRPSLRQTARTMVLMYAGFLVAGTVLYALCGMSVFDGVCHTMSALSTAGFSPRADNIGYYGSVPVEIVTNLLMLVGATNFAVLLFLVRRKFKQAFKVSEVRFMLALTAVFTIITGLCLWRSQGTGFFQSLHNAAFGVISTFTTTGYSTADYSVWPPLAVGLLLILMIIGGSTGSTAGGIKLSRAQLALLIIRQRIREKFAPSHTISIPHYQKPQGKANLDEATAADVMGFIGVYLLIVIAGTLVLTAFEPCSLLDAFYEFASAFGTVGLSCGLAATAQAPALITLMAGMVLGRLEIYIVFVGIWAVVKRARKGL